MPDNTREEQTVTITCGNCYQEAEARLFSIGKDINTFYKSHRTRIGKTFCSIDAICIRYDPITKAQEQLLDELEAQKDEFIWADDKIYDKYTKISFIPMEAIEAKRKEIKGEGNE